MRSDFNGILSKNWKAKDAVFAPFGTKTKDIKNKGE